MAEEEKKEKQAKKYSIETIPTGTIKVISYNGKSLLVEEALVEVLNQLEEIKKKL